MINKILNKLIIYNYIRDNINYRKENFLSDITFSIRSITRQTPSYILNKKNEIIGTKTTLINNNLNLFLYKLKKFTLIKLYNTSVFHKNMCSLDTKFNLHISLNNKSYFFEYFNYSTIEYTYKFSLTLLFNKCIDNKTKLKYILKTLNIKL